MIKISVSGAVDFPALGERWRRLEQRSRCSFFQGWTWTGCLAEERFPDPVLVEAVEDGETVALALFNRRAEILRGDVLALGESGDQVMDCPYIEYNGVLTAAGREATLSVACLKAARRQSRRRPCVRTGLILSGISDDTLHAVRLIAGGVWVERSQPAPFVDLARVRRENGGYLPGRSANTRQQIRRSDRAFAGLGPLMVRRAETAREAHDFLDALAPLHQATWVARGKPGSFSHPFFARFHHALIDRGMERNEIDLLRVTAGNQVIGILYNFRFGRQMLAYQSGFDYADSGGQRKPGLTCHHQAIRFCLSEELDRYDFLAGEDRYKRSLSHGDTTLHWVRAGFAWEPWLIRRKLSGCARRIAGYGG